MSGALDWLMQRLGGDPEAEGAAQTSTAMQPAVLDHLQNVLSDMPGRFGGVSYDSNRSLAQNAKDPGGVQQAVSIGMQIGPAAIRAYHGSPHSFDRFDLSKVGTGEGAQMYGHGIYFAGNEAVARQYRDNLGVRQWLQGKEFNDDLTPHRPGMVAQYMQNGVPEDTTRMALRTLEPHASDSQIAEWLQRGRALHDEAQSHGKMYEVNLHADPEALLGWDKPLSRQSPGVQEVLADRFGIRPHTGGPMEFHKYPAGMYAGPDPTGASIYQRLIQDTSPTGLARLDAPARISQELRDAGVPGVRYLDQGSRGAGEGTSNYVMFDDKLIEILRKYGLAGLTAGAGGAAALGGGAAEAAPADALDRIRRQLGGP